MRSPRQPVETPDYSGPERRGQVTRFKLWMVTGLCAALLAVAVYLETEWRKGVNESISKVPAIELQAMAAVIELREIRKEQLAFYAIFYERIGAEKKADELLSVLGRLERRPPQTMPTPPPTPKRQ